MNPMWTWPDLTEFSIKSGQVQPLLVAAKNSFVQLFPSGGIKELTLADGATVIFRDGKRNVIAGSKVTFDESGLAIKGGNAK